MNSIVHEIIKLIYVKDFLCGRLSWVDPGILLMHMHELKITIIIYNNLELCGRLFKSC